MTIPYNFKYLNIQPFLVDLQRSPDGKSQLISSVTQKGLHYFTPDGTLPSLESHVEVTLSRHGLLQVCLQRTNPFQQCMDDEIRCEIR